MSISVPKKNSKSVLPEQITIIVLLVVILTFGLLIVYKSIIKEKPITPQEADLKRLTSFVETNPADKQGRLLLAYTYQKNHEYAKAVQEYNTVLKMDSKNLEALYNLGVIAKEENDHAQAEKLLKQVASMQETHILARIALSEVYIAKSNYDAAIKVLDEAIKIESTLVRPRILKAQALEKKGNKKGAIAEYKEVLKFVPTHEEALSALKRLK